MACIPIASQIVKETVPEFSDMSLDDIGKCFLSVDSACIGVDTDTTHTAVRQAIGLSTEDKTVSEGVVTYDVKTIDVLNTLIDTDASSEEKLIKLEKMGISITDDLREEVSEMCNFSEGVAYKAREKGRAEGRAEGLAEGRAEGQNQLRSLLRLLKNEGREEDIEKVMDDAEFAAEMIEKYKDQI